MSALGQTAKMVQPNEGSAGSYGPLCAGGSGDMSLGKPETIPPEIYNHEAFLRLRAENQDLRVALEQSNTMLRTRHGEMLEFQEAQRKEREFIAIKFNEAKSLVLRLTRERDSLQGHLEEMKRHQAAWMARDEEDMRKGHNEANSSPESSTSSCETLTQSMCETLRETARNHAGPSRAEQDLQKLMEANLKLENKQNRILDSAATNGEEPEVRKLAAKVDVLQGAGGRNSRAEQDLREKLQEAERRNIHLEEQMEELTEEFSRLRRHLAEQAEEAQRKLQLLAEEKMSVKAQVTSLLGELHESQRSLEISTQEKRKVEESLRCAQEQQREWEAQMKQQVLQLDQHRLQVQNLEAALKMERQNAREEMRKLAQLQSAYHKLFQEYDAHIKSTLPHEKLITSLEVQIQDLKQQLQEAEEALVAKQDLIDKLKVETDEQKGLKETVGVLKAQADIFRTDFLTEREERARLHAEKQKLQEQLEEVLRERLRNESEGARARIEEMRNRHSDTLRQSMPGMYQTPYATPPPPSIHPLVERQEYCCPKCQYRAPDIDTLQIHVMDCIQ